MSANISFDSNLKQPALPPENKPPEKESSLVLYHRSPMLQGRGIVRANQSGHELVFQSLSFVEKLFIQIAFDTGRSLSDVNFAAMPKQFLDLSKNINSMLSFMLKHEDEDQIVALNDQLSQQMAQARTQQVAALYQLYAKAGVRNHQELDAKQARIGAFKDQAQALYLSRPMNIALKIQIDEMMAKAGFGKLSNEDRETIHSFWQMVSESAEGSAMTKRVEDRFTELFTESLMNSIMGLFQSMQQPQDGALSEDLKGNFFKGMRGKITTELQKINAQLQKEKTQTDNNNTKIEIDYLLLKGRLQAPVLINMVLRQIFGQQAETLEANVRGEYEGYILPQHAKNLERTKDRLTQLMDPSHYKRRYISDRLKKIDSYVELAKTAREAGDEQKAIHNEEVIKVHTQYMERDKKILADEIDSLTIQLARLEATTPDQLLEKAYSLQPQNPMEIRAAIPIDTPYEIAMRKILGVDSATNALMSPTGLTTMLANDPTINLDLTKLADPVLYFAEQIQTVDAKSIQILQEVTI
jgi:hypothetical protein